MEFFSEKMSFRNLGRRKMFSAPPKLGARSPPLGIVGATTRNSDMFGKCIRSCIVYRVTLRSRTEDEKAKYGYIKVYLNPLLTDAKPYQLRPNLNSSRGLLLSPTA